MDKDVAYTVEYYLAIKKNEITQFATTWMDLDIAILSEVSQKRRRAIIWQLLNGDFKKK